MGIVMEWSVGFVGVWVMGCVDWIGWVDGGWGGGGWYCVYEMDGRGV